MSKENPLFADPSRFVVPFPTPYRLTPRLEKKDL